MGNKIEDEKELGEKILGGRKEEEVSRLKPGYLCGGDVSL